MIKITKSYKIKFSKGGITQYADFREADGVLVRPSLHVSWVKCNEIPDVSNMKSIDEILEAIKSFAYCNRAEIYLIDGYPVFYYRLDNTKQLIENIKTERKEFTKGKILSFYESQLVPLLKKNKWKISTSHVGYLVLIEKIKGEWDNVKDYNKLFEFEYLCAECLLALDIIDSIKLCGEGQTYLYESTTLFSYIYDEIKNTKIYLDI